VRVLKTKVFSRFQRKERIADRSLLEAVRTAENGLIDADLGSGLIKQRVARPGEGKRGGYRTIIAYREDDRAVFLYGFAKNAKSDLEMEELAALARIGARWLSATAHEIEVAVTSNEVTEVADEQAE
jgi:hypothetical protein